MIWNRSYDADLNLFLRSEGTKAEQISTKVFRVEGRTVQFVRPKYLFESRKIENSQSKQHTDNKEWTNWPVTDTRAVKNVCKFIAEFSFILCSTSRVGVVNIQFQ